MDSESTAPLSQDLASRLQQLLQQAAPTADILTIEDYAKGVCTPGSCRSIIQAARNAGKDILVDPAKLTNFDRYSGATAITPNRTEAEFATGQSACDDATPDTNAMLARAVRDQAQVDTVILTLDRHGALLLEADDSARAIPTNVRQIYDVTGAGDMVLAALAAARANAMSWSDATRLANVAAGLEVEIVGVQPIPFERLHQQVLTESRRLAGKLRTLDEAHVEVAAARRDSRRIVFTNGCFDIIHAGHIRLLQEARKHGDLLIVALNSDASITRLKGESRPLYPLHDRIAVISELESVGIVVVFEDDTPMQLLEALRPDVLVKGGDYTKDEVVGASLIESFGGRVQIIPHLKGRSTTQAIARLKRA